MPVVRAVRRVPALPGLPGVTAVILAVGLNSSLAKVNEVPNLGMGQTHVMAAAQQSGPPAPMTSSQSKAIEAALRAQPGTQRYVPRYSAISTPWSACQGCRTWPTVPGAAA